MNTTRVGVGIFIICKNKILLGKRLALLGEKSWALPGGHLEFGESPEEAVIRETEEETGYKIKNPTFTTFTNDFFEKENKHYITLFFKSRVENPNVILKEPEKCERWDWFEWGKWPKPLFLPTENAIKQNSHLLL